MFSIHEKIDELKIKVRTTKSAPMLMKAKHAEEAVEMAVNVIEAMAERMEVLEGLDCDSKS